MLVLVVLFLLTLEIFSNLKVLDLSSNYYENFLKADDMAWAFSLSSLQLLYLSAVDLSRAQNWDMVLHMIPSLKYLHLRYNSCKGPLPGLFQNMTSLTFQSYYKRDPFFVRAAFVWLWA